MKQIFCGYFLYHLKVCFMISVLSERFEVSIFSVCYYNVMALSDFNSSRYFWEKRTWFFLSFFLSFDNIYCTTQEYYYRNVNFRTLLCAWVLSVQLQIAFHAWVKSLLWSGHLICSL